MKPFNPNELDPGIRETVLFLQSEGFETVDSGDGFSKPAGEMAMSFPHVVIQCNSRDMIDVADRLARVVKSAGGVPNPLAFNGIQIQASYDPFDGSAVIVLANFVIENYKG